MFPSECVFESRVLADGDADHAANNLPLFILECEDRKAEGYADDQLEIYNKMLKAIKIGVRLAGEPPAVSYLAILGSNPSADIVALNKTVIVIRLDFRGRGAPLSYLIYDAVALSLRMIPAPDDPAWTYTVTSTVSVARPCRGPDYALVHTGRLVGGSEDSLFLWQPSSSSPPWSDFKKAGLLHITGWSRTNKQFSFNGHSYWVDLLQGAFRFNCDALFDDKSSSVLEFIPLPTGIDHHIRSSFDQRMAEPAAYRTMGIVNDSFIRFVSIDGFQDYVKLKDRTVTVWKLLDHDKGWDKEHEFSLKALWRFRSLLCKIPKDLTPMYPILSMDPDVVYLGFGEYSETKIVQASRPPKWEFFPHYPRYMLAVDMRNKIVQTILPMDPEVWLPSLVSCGFSRYLRKALVGPSDEGVSSPMKKKLRLE